jgi:dTDP-4-amino-4,6-dideoxygalactose transaminase
MTGAARIADAVPAIPSADPGAACRRLRTEIDAAIARVLDRGRYVLDEEVEAFEREFAAATGARHAIGVGNGTDGLELALRAVGIGPGDEVITVSHTSVAIVAAIERIGGRPRLVDVSPGRWTMDPDALRRAVEGPARKARAVVPVHLYGHPAEMDAILEISRSHGLEVVEDCAQAHGGLYRGERVGSLGAASAFSFYPTKNLGALGDGGAVVTDDDAIAERVRHLRQYGWRERYVSEVTGCNSRLDEIQAAILRVKLPHLEADNAMRRHLAALYARGLAGLPLAVPTTASDCVHVFHQHAIETDHRDALRRSLADRGIGSSVLYPVPIHLQPAYRHRLEPAGPLPCSEAAAARLLCLPIHPELEDRQIETVCGAVAESLR